MPYRSLCIEICMKEVFGSFMYGLDYRWTIQWLLPPPVCGLAEILRCNKYPLRFDFVLHVSNEQHVIGYTANRSSLVGAGWAGAVMRGGAVWSRAGAVLCTVPSISRHPKFRVTDVPTYLPSFLPSYLPRDTPSFRVVYHWVICSMKP